ncbi:MAG: fasciclin domain-containing protein [Caldilineaceae bacterium]|nr:fasciclin domain-containing protein [Caldilineaceae bacterium]
MKHPHLIVSVLFILALLFSGCYVNDQGVFVMGATAPVGESVGDDATPDATETAEPSQESLEPAILEATVNTRSLRVRQGPSVETAIVAGLREGTVITVLGRSADGIWLQIQVPDVETTGWVSAEFVTVSGQIASLAITDGSTEDTMVAAPPPTATPIAEPTATAIPVTPQIDLVETASAVDDFSTLVTALEAAGLVDALSAEGPFTVFAPTDDAFAAMPAGALNALLADPEGALAQILLFHVVPGEILAADISDNMEIDTLQGETLTFSIAGGAVTVNGANIILTDIAASNGVVHVIDAVLTPSVVDLESIIAALAAAEVATPTPAAVVTETETITPTGTITPAQEAVATPVPTVAAPAGGSITLAASNTLAEVNTGSTQTLRVRRAPDLNADVVWGVRNGEFFAVVEQSADGAWTGLAIPRLRGVGWVSSEFIILSQDVAVIPTLGSVTVATSDGARLRVRNAPSVDAELRSFLNEGETYEVVAVTADGQWALINIPRTAGPSWIATEFIQIGAPQQ